MENDGSSVGAAMRATNRQRSKRLADEIADFGG